MPEPAAAPMGLILLAGAEEPATAVPAVDSSRPIILPQLMPPRLALPRPGAARPHGDSLALLALLAAQAQAGDLAGAAGTTAALLGLDSARAVECAGVYHRRQALDPDFIAGSMLLVPALEAARPDDALPLLTYCFGLEPAEAAAAYRHLRAKSGERA
jgi:hypothetical protein